MLCSDQDKIVVEATMETKSNMNNTKVTIKAVHNGDIRRITIDDNLGFKDLKKLLKKLYKPSYSFNISYQDEENDWINIKSDLDLQTAVRQASKHVLRITIEATEDPLVRSVANDNNTLNESRNECDLSSSSIPLLGRRDEIPIRQIANQTDSLRSQVEDLVMQTVTSKPVLDAIAQALLPQILQALRESPSTSTITTSAEQKSFDLNSLLMESIPQTIQQTGVEMDRTIAEESEDSISESTLSEEQRAEEPLAESNQENELEASSEPEEKEEKEEVEIKEEVESLVIVDRSAPPKRDSHSALRSLLALFKISPKNRRADDQQPNDANEEEEVEIPNLEETLKQLADMGFSDREANIKLLRFHKKYNEGVDEVVEDLLLQMQEKMKPQPVQVMTEEVRN